MSGKSGKVGWLVGWPADWLTDWLEKVTWQTMTINMQQPKTVKSYLHNGSTMYATIIQPTMGWKYTLDGIHNLIHRLPIRPITSLPLPRTAKPCRAHAPCTIILTLGVASVLRNTQETVWQIKLLHITVQCAYCMRVIRVDELCVTRPHGFSNGTHERKYATIEFLLWCFSGWPNWAVGKYLIKNTGIDSVA